MFIAILVTYVILSYPFSIDLPTMTGEYAYAKIVFEGES